MPLHFQSLITNKLRIEADPLIPEKLLGLGLEEIARLAIPLGKGSVEVAEVFKLSGSPLKTIDDPVVFEGDLGTVGGIGRGMTGGFLRIDGNAGDDVGLGMAGGRIEALGDVGRRAGLEMSGGFLSIRGNAGHSLGGSREGARLGMKNGVILVKGNAGDDVGRRMRRGLIAIEGKAGDALGGRLVAGSIFVFGDVGRAVGLGMKRGTIGLFGTTPTTPLPSFAETGRHRFPFLTIYLKQLTKWGVSIAPEMFSAGVTRYNGDLAEKGMGEILSRA